MIYVVLFIVYDFNFVFILSNVYNMLSSRGVVDSWLVNKIDGPSRRPVFKRSLALTAEQLTVC